MTTELGGAPSSSLPGEAPPTPGAAAAGSGGEAAASATGGPGPTATAGGSSAGPSTPVPPGEGAAAAGGAAEFQPEWKTDKITEVQDTIDSLSLSLFEALRGLRDAVAPEEAAAQQQLAGGPAAAAAPDGGASKGGTAPVDDDPDYDDFLVSYHNKDPAAIALVANSPEGKVPRSREEYVKLLARAEMEKDAELVSRLAEEVLSKSEMVEELVGKLPGMGRTREQQMKRIEELLEKNKEVAQELEGACEEAERRREEVREVLGGVTCEALGIEEEGR